MSRIGMVVTIRIEQKEIDKSGKAQTISTSLANVPRNGNGAGDCNYIRYSGASEEPPLGGGWRISRI
jgi:hypothetical protein